MSIEKTAERTVDLAALHKQKVVEAKLRRAVNRNEVIHLVIRNEGDLTKLQKTLKGIGPLAVVVNDHSTKQPKPPKAEVKPKPEEAPKA